MNTRQSQTSTTPIPVPGAESLGAILRATRIAQHLEPKDISDRLRMNLSIIQALETDDYKALGAPVFARMYLLRYSQLLDLPEHEVLARYKALGLDEPPPLHVAHPIRPQTRMRDIRWISYPLVLALVIWLGWMGLERVSSDFKLADVTTLVNPNAGPDASLALPRQQQTLALPGIARGGHPATTGVPGTTSTATVGLSTATAQAEELPNQAAANSTSSASENSNAVINSIPSLLTPPPSAPAPAVAVPNPTPPTATPATANLPGTHTLALEFSEQCWVEVKDAKGERLLFGVMRGKEKHTLSGAAPFSIKLGNINAVQIKLDERLIDKTVYAPKRGTVVRFVLEAPKQG